MAARLHVVDRYARDVVQGRVPAGKYHRLACERHMRERARRPSDKFPYVFSPEHADRFFRFARRMRHYKGRQFAGQYFEPTPVQQFRLGSIFGWRHWKSGLRRFTVAYNDLPRKHGKSFEGAVVLSYATFFEGEPGAEGYCIATKEKQARIVFSDAKKLVKQSGLSSRIEIRAWQLFNASSESFAQPLGADSDTTDGLNPHVTVVDELHAMKSRDLVDVMESATGARMNPLFFFITTHGKEMVSVWGDYITYAMQILDGVLEDDQSTMKFFAFIAHADVGDDPFDERTMIKANPHWGVSVNPDDMRTAAAKAKRMPSAAAEYKQKRLNMLPEASAPWLSMEGWRAGQTAEGFALEDFRGREAWIGLDLSSNIDLCALVALLPPRDEDERFVLLRWVWTPAETMAARALKDRAPYEVWAQRGCLLTQPGRKLSHKPIRDTLKAVAEVLTVIKVGYDKWHAHQLVNDLVDEDGFSAEQIIEVPQTYQGVSEAAKRLESEVLDGNVDAGACPLMSWTFSNAVVQRDGKDNIQPIKKRSRGRIDPVSATVNALACWLREPRDDGESIYETRDLVTVGGQHA